MASRPSASLAGTWTCSENNDQKKKEDDVVIPSCASHPARPGQASVSCIRPGSKVLRGALGSATGKQPHGSCSLRPAGSTEWSKLNRCKQLGLTRRTLPNRAWCVAAQANRRRQLIQRRKRCVSRSLWPCRIYIGDSCVRRGTRAAMSLATGILYHSTYLDAISPLVDAMKGLVESLGACDVHMAGTHQVPT